jgi:hypothetical protein
METRTVDLGPCHCPGTPHERDEALIMTPAAMKFGIQRRVQSAYEMEVNSARAGLDSYGGLADATLMALCVVSWTCADDKGQPLPIGIHAPSALASIDALDPETGMALHEVFFPQAVVVDGVTIPGDRSYALRALTGVLLPNPSSAPSAAGQPAPTPTDSEPSPKD